jgi:peptidoglycan/xylan/chitin deacetylase (PgdA/CDA1 family)
MNVYLTFDIEVWCGGWDHLDERFPASYERYVYGRSKQGDYALPVTLDLMDRHGLKGIFFVEPLFSARFGSQYLRNMVDLIQSRGHSVQLHLHPEWTDEIEPHPLPKNLGKRQHLIYYSEEEQTALIALGKVLLAEAGVPHITMFRAGSYAANSDTFRALARNGLRVDSSLNECFEVSGGDVGRGASTARDWAGQQQVQVGEITSYPITVFEDGLGRLRPAQVGACGLAELGAAMQSAEALGHSDFVIVSHNFELLKPDSSLPDPWMVRRFSGLCELLARRADRWHVSTDMVARTSLPASTTFPRARVSAAATLRRYAEQAARRFF